MIHELDRWWRHLYGLLKSKLAHIFADIHDTEGFTRRTSRYYENTSSERRLIYDKQEPLSRICRCSSHEAKKKRTDSEKARFRRKPRDHVGGCAESHFQWLVKVGEAGRDCDSVRLFNEEGFN